MHRRTIISWIAKIQNNEMLKLHYLKQGGSCNCEQYEEWVWLAWDMDGFIEASEWTCMSSLFDDYFFTWFEGFLLVCKGIGILEVGSKIRLRVDGHLCMWSVTKGIRIWGWWVYGKLKQETIRNLLGVDCEDSLLLCPEL